MSTTVLIYAIVLIVAAATLRWIVLALKRKTPVQKNVSLKRHNVQYVWTGSKQVIWHKEIDENNRHRLVRFADEKTQTLLEGGSIEVFDAFWEEWSTLFIRHTQGQKGQNEQLYAVHKKNATELQLLGAWPLRRDSKIKAFRKSHAYPSGYYDKIPLILYQTNGVSFVDISESGEVALRQITDTSVELFLTEEIKDAIELILDTGDDDIIENIDELECANAIDFTFSVRRAAKDATKNIDVYRLRFKDLEVTVECLHEGCSSYQQEYRGQFYLIEKDGFVSMHRRLVNEVVISGFDASQSWAYDTVKIDGAWHYAFIGVKNGICMANVNDDSRQVAPSEGAVEIRIIDDEAFYQLERTENGVDVYDVYCFSDQRLLASFYEASPYLARHELSAGARLDYDECGCEPAKVPYHRLSITLGDLAKDPSLIDKLRLPHNSDEEDEEDAKLQELSDQLEKHPIHTPGLRRG